MLSSGAYEITYYLGLLLISCVPILIGAGVGWCINRIVKRNLVNPWHVALLPYGYWVYAVAFYWFGIHPDISSLPISSVWLLVCQIFIPVLGALVFWAFMLRRRNSRLRVVEEEESSDVTA